MFIEPLPDRGERAFETRAAVIGALEVFLLLIDGVVGQVHCRLLGVFHARRVVLLSAEARQTLIVQVHPQRVARSDKHIDPNVELEVVNEERGFNVCLGDSRRGEGAGPFRTVSEEDPLSLCACERACESVFVCVCVWR